MPKALIDTDRCTPERCPDGRCAVRSVCAVRAVYQEEPFEPPFLDWSRCHACSRCVVACPARAISLVE
jgi:Fe-S-cluster-containing hydrogenase component 2